MPILSSVVEKPYIDKSKISLIELTFTEKNVITVVFYVSAACEFSNDSDQSQANVLEKKETNTMYLY